MFKCESIILGKVKCGKTFNNAFDLSRHIKLRHPLAKPLLQKAMEMHSEEMQALYRSESFVGYAESPNALKNHLEKNHADKKEKRKEVDDYYEDSLNCRYCNKPFTDHEKKATHEETECKFQLKKRKTQDVSTCILPLATGPTKGILKINKTQFEDKKEGFVVNNNVVRTKDMVATNIGKRKYATEEEKIVQFLSQLSMGIFAHLFSNKTSYKYTESEAIVEVQCLYISELNCLILNENAHKKFQNIKGRKIKSILGGPPFEGNGTDYEKDVIDRWLTKLGSILNETSERYKNYCTAMMPTLKALVDLVISNPDIKSIGEGEFAYEVLRNNIFCYENLGYGEKIHAEMIHSDLLQSMSENFDSDVYVAGTKRPCLTCFSEYKTASYNAFNIQSNIFQPGCLFPGQLNYATPESRKEVVDHLAAKEIYYTTAYVKKAGKKYKDVPIKDLIKDGNVKETSSTLLRDESDSETE